MRKGKRGEEEEDKLRWGRSGEGGVEEGTSWGGVV